MIAREHFYRFQAILTVALWFSLSGAAFPTLADEPQDGSEDVVVHSSDVMVQSSAVAGTDAVATPAGSALAGDRLVVGITGHYRVGRWTAVTLSPAIMQDAIAASGSSRSAVAIETIDGDGVRVRYQQVVAEKENATSEHAQQEPTSSPRRVYAIPGSEAAPLIVRVVGDSADENGSILKSTRFPVLDSPSRGESMVPTGMPWIVAIGDPMGIDQIGANELLGRDATVAVSKPVDASELPDSSLGYDGVDLIVISGDGDATLKAMLPAQQTAMTDWLRDGGRVLLTLGESTESFQKDAPWVLQWLPVDRDELSLVSIDPSALETYTSTRVPLKVFRGAKLPRDLGNTLVTGRTTRRISTPIAVRYGFGFGQVTVVAADLNDEPFADWPDRIGLITLLTGNLLSKPDNQAFQASRATAFTDLAGQARSTLDQFPMKRKFSFSVISLIVLSLVALIGPLDYLLINRVFGKPLLGWLTFPLVAIGLSALLVYQSRAQANSATARANSATARANSATPRADSQQLKGNQPSDSNTAAASPPVSDVPPSTSGCAANRLEIVDIDTETERGRVFSWNVIYSHPANRFDVDIQPSESLTRMGSQFQSAITFPYGYPGTTFGGIQIAGEDLRMPAYRIAMTSAQGDASNRDGSEQRLIPTRQSFDAKVQGMPLAPRSSKSLATQVRFRSDPIDPDVIRRRPGSDLLAGELVNPLPVDLLDGMLIYQNWVYLLPTRFPSGASIPSVDTLRQKNFRWQLSRKKALESSSQGEDWNVADFGILPRVTEMLMFHNAVGGTRYTRLRHDPLGGLDLSYALTEDRCMLVGRLASPATQRVLSGAHDSGFDAAGESLTVIRVIMPVQRTNRY